MRGIALWAGLAALAVACERWLVSCVGMVSCLSGLTGPQAWFSLALAAAGLLVTACGIGWMLRTLWLVVASRVRLARLPTASPPEQLLTLARQLGIPRLRFLPDSADAVFCAGAARPTVFIGRGVSRRLSVDELRAVLLHEQEHAASFDPLRRAAWRAAGDIFFFLPLVKWRRRRHLEDSELRADRRAIQRVDPRSLASALWSLGGADVSIAAAAFSGTLELRVSQLLGDPLPRRVPPASLLLKSITGTAFALAVMACVLQVAGRVS